MLDGATQTLCKSERLNSMTLISRLFTEPGSQSTTIFPVRAIYKTVERTDDSPAVRVLMSVPKRKLHNAVDRNRVKRQVREAYRRHRDLYEIPEGKYLAIAFIWLDHQHHDSAEVEEKVANLLRRLGEKLAR